MLAKTMHNHLPKKILELEDVEAISPVRAKLSLIPEHLAREYEIVPFDGEGMKLALVTTNNFSEQLKSIYDGLQKAGYTPDVYYTGKEGIQIALGRYSDVAQQIEADAKKLKAQQESVGKNAIQQIIDLAPQRSKIDPGEFLMEVIKFSFQAGASDLHFQVESKDIILRLRIDGVMTEVLRFNVNEYLAYIQKIKMRGGMKMNIDYLPQDGRMSFEVDLANKVHKKIDVRINLLPGLNNLENVVMRFLDGTTSVSTFEELGFWGRNYDSLKRVIQKNEGMILVTGPTGSGKTTTLYTILESLKDGTQKIVTLEDPIEYTIDGIEQSQINHEKGYNFEKGLEALLRHDPDIILVGETRSTETANTSLNAALTGHLVFSTLHTNSALEAIPRLLMMGVEAYLLAPSLQAILAQRLVRKICPHCGTWRQASEQEDSFVLKEIEKIQEIRPDLQIEYNHQVPTAAGCEQCNGTGYIGRTAVLEIIELTPELREKIVDDLHNTAELMVLLRLNGFLTMQEDGLIKMLEMQTTMDELRRVM